MSYVLEAILGRSDVLAAMMAPFRAARTVPLQQGISLVPLTDPLLHELAEPTGDADSMGFIKLSPNLHTMLRDWSAHTPIAYVKAEYFGGTGDQRATVWSGAQVVLGPITDESDESLSEGCPILQALRALGVAAGDHRDEFDAVGLGLHRHTDDWS